MENLILLVKSLIKKYKSKKFNKFVKKYYKINKHKNIKFSKNIWNRNVFWDFYFQSAPNSNKSSNYVPYDYYNYKILPKLNDSSTKIYIQDKNMFDKVFAIANVKLPKTLFRCMNHIFLDINYKKIDNIESYIMNIRQDFIIKNARDSGGGKGVEKFIFDNNILKNVKNGKSFNANEFRKLFKGDFIVQEVIDQHIDLGKFHPPSVNSIKLLTYRSVKTNIVYVLTAEIRIGVNESFVDNGGQGGLAVGIKIDDENNGTVREYGFFEVDNYCSFHPDTKIKFKNSKIHNFHVLVDRVKEMSNIVPYQRLIGWDFSISKEGEPIFIEANYGSGIDALQLINGKPLFGKFTQEVKEYLDKL